MSTKATSNGVLVKVGHEHVIQVFKYLQSQLKEQKSTLSASRANSASHSLRRALLMPLVNPGSLQ